MRLTKKDELENLLQKQLLALKNNREQVPEQILKSIYKVPYYELLEKINQTATAYIKKIVLRDLPINPDVSIEAQLQTIKHTIAASYLPDAMGQNICHVNMSELQNMALELRKQIEDALLPYLTSRICVVIDLFEDKDPVIYNTLSQKLWTGSMWISYKMDLGGKFLLYFNSPYLKEIISGNKYEGEGIL